MINKQNIWFLTLFSLVLVLSIYYITMPNELLINNNTKVEETSKEDNNKEKISIEEADYIETMRVENDTEVAETIKELEHTLTNMSVSTKEKNKAYEELQNINKNTAKEDALESLIKNKLNYESFVKIEGNQIKVVIGNEKGSTSTANEVMRLIQDEFESKRYISVQFKDK